MLDKDGVGALHWACYAGDVNMINCLLAHGADQNTSDATGCRPISLTCKHGHVQATRILLHANAVFDPVDQLGRNCLMLAASMGHVEIVRLLLLYGADPVLEDFQRLSALDHARVGKHGLALDVMLQVCAPQLRSYKRYHQRSQMIAKSFKNARRVQEVDPAYYDSWEAHQADLFLRLSQEVVSDIYGRLMDFKEKRETTKETCRERISCESP